MPRNALIAALVLVLPLLVLVAGIVKSERHLARDRRWTFDITGYDPRDLLRGQYLQFQLDLHEDEAIETCADDDPVPCCLCLSADGPGRPTRVRRASCDTARRTCNALLQTRYLHELRRFYIPEKDAPALTARFQEAARAQRAKLVVAVDKTGKPQIDTILIDGRPLTTTHR